VLARLVTLVREHSQKPLVLDSPDPAVLARVCPAPVPDCCSIRLTLEKNRCETMLDLAMEYQTGLIALLMPADHFPATWTIGFRRPSRLLMQPPERASGRPLVPGSDDPAGIDRR
jgi:hypothetical protein